MFREQGNFESSCRQFKGVHVAGSISSISILLLSVYSLVDFLFEFSVYITFQV
jgi:hypothetical protein